MKEPIIRSMEEEADWSGCTGGKVRGGIILGKTNFGPVGQLLDLTTGNVRFWTCVCGSDMLIPVPASLVKSAAKGLLGKQTFGWIANFLKGKGAALKKALRPKVLEKMQEKLDKADEAVKAYSRYMSDPENGFRLKYQGLIEQRDQIIAAMKSSSGFAYKYYRQYEKYAKIIRRGEMVDDSGKIVKLSPEQVNDFMEKARQIISNMPEPLGKQFRDVVKDLIPLRVAEEKGIALLDEAARMRQAKSKIDEAFSNSAENFEDALNAVPPELKDLVLSTLMHGLFALLDATTIIMEKNCLSNQTGLPDGMMGAELNQDTCRCSNCPPRYPDLCDVSSWVADFLPSLPGSRQSDEFNVCIECCDNARPKARWFTGGSIGDILKEFGVAPCTCECPTEIDGGPTKWVGCKDPDACDNGGKKQACKTKNPPDDPDGSTAKSGTGFISKYRWDSPTCKWVCKVPCASGCCSEGEYCTDGQCGSCPPGYRTRRATADLFAQETTYECVQDCSTTEYPENACQENYCCTESLFETDIFGMPMFECTPCLDKTHSLRFESDTDQPNNPWASIN